MKQALVIIILFMSACQTKHVSNDYLLRVTDSLTDKEGYINATGDTVIAIGKYEQCFTDTFKRFAIVAKPVDGWVGIDRTENVLFKVFPSDNGPDDPAEGYFRIAGKNDKMGFANTAGRITIQPQFGCALPFEHNVAKVGDTCTYVLDGEHLYWRSQNWYYIDKTGKRVK